MADVPAAGLCVLACVSMAVSIHRNDLPTLGAPAEALAVLGASPLVPGVVAQLPGHTVHAEICRAVVDAVASGQAAAPDPPHPEINLNHPEAGTILHWATRQRLREASLAILACRHFEVVDVQLARDGSTALHFAAAEGMHEVVQALMLHPRFSSIRAVDRDGFTALHGAAFQGHAACAKLLLEHPDFGDAKGIAGTFDVVRPVGHWARDAVAEYDMTTALHMAACRNHHRICELILTLAPMEAANADATNRMGATALHMAARAGHTESCTVILEQGSFTAVNARDARGFTALHLAAQQPSGYICAALLRRKDFTAGEKRDLRGRTAMDIAKEKSHYEVQRLLVAHLGMAALTPTPQ